MNPYQVVKDFEQALCEYTGSTYAVTVTSCTMALLLACKWFNIRLGWAVISIPKYTYVSVPQSIKHAGHRIEYRDEEWIGKYQLEPLPIWDCARLFTSGMYEKGQYQCLSFHWSKTLAIGQGGAILHDNPEADEWFRRARFDGRTENCSPKGDFFNMLAYHCYMSPRDAAEGLSKLAVLPEHNAPLPNDEYPDLSKIKVFT